MVRSLRPNVFTRSQPQCLCPRLEWEQLLEQHRTLQDSFDQLQAEAKFEADQARQQLHDRLQEMEELKAKVMVSEFINSSTILVLKCGL